MPKVAVAHAAVKGERAVSEEASAVARVEQVEQVDQVETTVACSLGQIPHMRCTPRCTSL